MRFMLAKIIVMNRVSLDGYFAGPNGEIDWFIPDPAVDRAAHKLMHVDAVLFGRLTYQLMESYWPNAAKDPNTPEGVRKTAGELQQMTKIVFSRTLKEVSWKNTQLINDDMIHAVKKLKSDRPVDMTIFGSGSIIQQLASQGLIDRYLLIVTPVILGKGKPMFAGVKKMDLELLETMSFASGNVLLQYAA
jgi:dihydrofolate reductase